MKKNIHPKYSEKSEVKCVCGNVFHIGSTKERFDVEICYNCHPFYTGKAKIVDVAGRVEKFKARHATKSATPVRKKSEKKAEKATKKASK